MPRNIILFDEIISVEEIGGFKPDAKVYHFAAKR
jgi:FMN phosphatase YigB (HAD superfamily)